MQSYDLRGDILAVLRGSRCKLNERSNPAKFCCPRHDDTTPSAWIGDAKWGCYACGFEEFLETLAGELGVVVPEKQSYGLTVSQYAERKGFSVLKLTEWGVRNGTGKYNNPVVVIPYKSADGIILREKWRTPKKSFWAPGQGTYLYGLDMLAKRSSSTPLILVEGESDCHAAWLGGVLAVGVPGASGWKSGWKSLIGDRPLYVWQEPDEGGAQLVASIVADFPDVHVIVASPDGPKDLADLYREAGSQFKQSVKALMASAIPASQREAEIPFDALLGGTLDVIRREKEAPIDAVPTPFPAWNEACRGAGGGIGLARGWHLLLAGNTGQGKSLVALNVGVCAIEHGENVAFVSLEMSQSELATRALAIVSGEDVRELEQGHFYTSNTFARAQRAMDAIRERTGGAMFVNRHAVSDLAKIEAAIRYQHEYNGCRFVIMDYMQLAHVAKARGDIERITEVSHTIRGLAADLKIITLGLSQYNRETSKDYERPPTPQGLHGGSALENDSHQVLLLNHTEYTKEEGGTGAATQLMLAKNRHGPSAILTVRYDYRTLTVRQTGVITTGSRGGRYASMSSSTENANGSNRVAPAGPPRIRSAHPDNVPVAVPDNRGEAWEPDGPLDLSFPTYDDEAFPDAA